MAALFTTLRYDAVAVSLPLGIPLVLASTLLLTFAADVTPSPPSTGGAGACGLSAFALRFLGLGAFFFFLGGVLLLTGSGDAEADASSLTLDSVASGQQHTAQEEEKSAQTQKAQSKS